MDDNYLYVVGNDTDIALAQDVEGATNPHIVYIDLTECASDAERAEKIKQADVILGGYGADSDKDGDTGTYSADNLGIGQYISGSVRLAGDNRDQTQEMYESWLADQPGTCSWSSDCTCQSPSSPPSTSTESTYAPDPIPTPPTFHADRKTLSSYSYAFGLDKLKLYNAVVQQNCCFMSQEIPVGTFSEGEYIQIDARYQITNVSSVEFYIIDGSIETPVLPSNDTEAFNERIFYGVRPRFSVDTTKPITVKRDGIEVNITIDQAMQMNNGLYTASYTPLDGKNYKPISDTVKVKVIMRLYDKFSCAPYITKMKIRKYGRNGLWQQTI
jgi:hypothetical protein